MKIRNINQLNAFLAAVDQCEGNVWLESEMGDRYNMKSQFNRYIALGALLNEQGDYLELFCDNKDDERNFFKFFKENPEVHN